MATRKRSSRRSSTTRPARTRKFGKKTYTHDSCSTTKTGARKKAKSIRATGKKARVVGKCVYVAGSASAVSGKKRTVRRKRRVTRRK